MGFIVEINRRVRHPFVGLTSDSLSMATPFRDQSMAARHQKDHLKCKSKRSAELINDYTCCCMSAIECCFPVSLLLSPSSSSSSSSFSAATQSAPDQKEEEEVEEVEEGDDDDDDDRPGKFLLQTHRRSQFSAPAVGGNLIFLLIVEARKCLHQLNSRKMINKF